MQFLILCLDITKPYVAITKTSNIVHPIYGVN